MGMSQSRLDFRLLRSKLLLGAGIVGTNAGGHIAEVALAIEMVADGEDVDLTITSPHLLEIVGVTAEAFSGTIADLPKNRARSAGPRFSQKPMFLECNAKKS